MQQEFIEVVTDRGRRFINPQKVSSFAYRLDTITGELLQGDIYDIVLTVTLDSQETFELNDIRSISALLLHLFPNYHVAYSLDKKDILYYAKKSSEYWTTVNNNTVE